MTILLLFVSIVYSANLPTGFTEKRLASNLDPTGMAILPDGRILVTIKSGKVLLIKNDVVQTTPFITIPDVDNWNERGVLTLVVDPNFEINKYVYIYYTYKNPSSNISNNRVSRFTVNGDVALVSSELVLINFNNLSSVGWHNGGGLVYGTDGKIYASTGENANSSYAQNMSTLLGKVIRINPDGTIPSDNPFYNTASGQNRAIYALGFRNPFKIKMQPGSGKIYVNDVGAGNWEEINEIKAGGNYGWPGIEGKRTNQTAPANYQDPVFAYSHSGNVCSITGGTFYNPSVQHFPAQYENKYFFLDYCAGWMRYIDPANNYVVSNFATGIDRGLDLLVDNQGNLYYLARGGIGGGSDADNTSSNEGELWRITYTGSGNVSITVHPQDKKVAAGSPVTFVTSASGAAPLAYQWMKNGVDIPNANSSTYTITKTELTDHGAKLSVRVSNNSSSQTSNEATLSVFSNTAPVAQILSPAEGTLYTAGSSFDFSGVATDAEDEELPASAFTWTIEFHHDTHFHPGLDPTSGIKNGTYNVPDEGETSDTVWYRVILTVTDGLGTKTTIYRDVHPKKVEVTLDTEPSGLPLLLDGTAINTPYKFIGVIGLKRTIEAKNIIQSGNDLNTFVNWSNGGTAFQTIETPEANEEFIASYLASKTDTNGVLADAYVRGGSFSGNTYGTSDPGQLQTKSESTFEYTRQTYLRFDISKYPAILLGAKLRLYGAKNSNESNNINVGVYGVSSTIWNENTISWNNKPVAENELITSAIVNALPTAPQYYEWDVSEYVKNIKNGGSNQISFLLANPEVTTSYVYFNSKEASGNRPQLIISEPAVITGIDDIKGSENALSIAPQPFDNELTVSLKDESIISSLHIINLLGETVYMNLDVNAASMALGATLPVGVYILKVLNNNHWHTLKIVKSN